MQHLALSIVFCCWNFSFLVAQPADVKQEHADVFRAAYKVTQPEYIQLHTDKDIYFSSDDLWYKLYLVNAPYAVRDLSIVAYVEMITMNQQILTRQKLKCTNGLASGRITLPRELPNGMYLIRAFTNWMQNIGDSTFFEKQILILNAATESDGNFIQLNDAAKKNNHHANVRAEGDTLILSRPNDSIRQIVIQSRGNILYQQGVEKMAVEERISLAGAPSGYIKVAWLNQQNDVLDELAIYHESGWPRLGITTNKTRYSPRDKIEIQLRVEDRNGNFPSGNFSVSVREVDPFVIPNEPPFDGTLSCKSIFESRRPLDYAKEKIVFPKPPYSLDPIPFPSKISGLQQNSADSGDHLQSIHLLKEKHRLESLAQESYQVETPVGESTAQRPPSDNTYYPHDFIALPTLREFIREIIPQARVKTKNGQDMLRLRNTENSNKVYFYSQNPLLLVDGAIVNDFNSILSMDPSAISRIDLSWRLNTINSAGVNALANHGIFAVYTKGSGKSKQPSDYLYEGFSTIDAFPSYPYNKKDENLDRLPDLRNPIYWNPDIALINGNARFSFYLSDGFGDFIIQVKGITHDGVLLSGEKKLTINFGGDAR